MDFVSGSPSGNPEIEKDFVIGTYFIRMQNQTGHVTIILVDQ